jgi:mercuric ion transport protein
MTDRTVIKTGIAGIAIAALCCITPALVPLLGAIELSAWLPRAGYVLLPGLVAIMAIAPLGFYRSDGAAATSLAAPTVAWGRRRSGTQTLACPRLSEPGCTRRQRVGSD